jgi:FkbM family methyltransferase
MYSFANFEPIIEQLCGVNKGYFVEIGALDGIDGSNTKYFEDNGWDGVCVEPNPDLSDTLRKNRKCRVETCAVWREDGTVKFQVNKGGTQMLSGIVDTYDKRHIDRINNEAKMCGATSEVVEVQAKRFDSIVTQRKIDFLSIDTEGSELEILKGIDLKHYDITVICIENNFLDPAHEQYMNSQGYKLHSTYLHSDQVYIKAL